ncbi:hypothetical protein ACSBR1_035581 [Camellia fascicularis]
MDSQQDCYFTNFLQERPNIDEHYLMESQYLNQNTQVFAQESQFTAEIESLSKKPQCGGNFTIEEDKLLVSAWFNISLDTLAMNKFCGCYAQIESLHQSGINEDDKISKAKIMYKELKKSTFQFEHY